MTREVVLATRNPHKVQELRQILAAEPRAADVRVWGLAEVRGGASLAEVVESGTTFAANALLKAHATARALGVAALADDSGLCVDVMGGAPGIFSARWAGHHRSDTDNVALLLDQLHDVLDGDRSARFVCAAALVTPDGREIVEHGEVRGTIVREPRGSGGFGYDPVMAPLGGTRTLAEYGEVEKNDISHRGHALRAIAPHLESLLT